MLSQEGFPILERMERREKDRLVRSWSVRGTRTERPESRPEMGSAVRIGITLTVSEISRREGCGSRSGCPPSKGEFVEELDCGAVSYARVRGPLGYARRIAR